MTKRVIILSTTNSFALKPGCLLVIHCFEYARCMFRRLCGTVQKQQCKFTKARKVDFPSHGTEFFLTFNVSIGGIFGFVGVTIISLMMKSSPHISLEAGLTRCGQQPHSL